MKTVKGKLIIKTQQALKENEGGIIIPEKARQVKSKIGEVIAVEPYPTGSTQRLWVGKASGKKRKVIISKERHNSDAALLGESVLLSEGQQFIGEDGVTYVSGFIEHVVAVVDTEETADIKVIQDGRLPDRCPRCKSAGQGNLLLDDKGYCTNCNLNMAGEHRSTYDHKKISDDVSDHMAGRTSRDTKQRAAGLATDNKIISYAGQKRHSALKTKK